MGLFSRKHTHKKSKTVVLFDIGSGSIGAAIVCVYHSKKTKPQILYSIRTPISYQHIPNFEQLTKSMLSTLLDVTLQLQAEGIPLLEIENAHKKERVVDDVLFTFASPWSITQSKVFNIENKKAFEVTHTMLDELIGEEVKAFDTSQDTVSSEGDKLILIDKKIIHSTLNGYSTTEPYDKTATSAEFHLVLSVISKHLYDKTREVVDQLLNGLPGNYNTLAMASFTAIRDIASDIDNFVILDIGAEVTDILNVRCSILKNLGSFPYGRYFAYRELSKKLGLMPEEIPSLLRNFFGEKNTPKEMLAISTALAEIGEAWLTSFEKILKEVTENTPLSRKLFLTSADDLSNWFVTILNRKKFGELIFSDGTFEIIRIDTDFLSAFIDKDKGITTIDPFIGLETVFLEKILYQSS